MLGSDDRRQLLLLRVQQLAKTEQDLGALSQRHVSPLRERGLSRGDDFIDVVLRCESELRGHLPGGGVGDIGEASAVALEDLAGFPVVERRCHFCSSYLKMLLGECLMIMSRPE